VRGRWSGIQRAALDVDRAVWRDGHDQVMKPDAVEALVRARAAPRHDGADPAGVRLLLVAVEVSGEEQPRAARGEGGEEALGLEARRPAAVPDARRIERRDVHHRDVDPRLAEDEVA